MQCKEIDYPFTCDEPVKCELEQGHSDLHEVHNGSHGVYRWSDPMAAQKEG